MADVDTALAQERARSEAGDRELADIAEQLRPIADMGRARELAFAIVALLLELFTRPLGATYDRSLAELDALLGLAREAVPTRDLGTWCERADRLASKYFSRVGPRGSWGPDLQIPYDIATALRRACEVEVWRFVPLVVREARAMLKRNGADVAPLDNLIARATREAHGDEGARR